MLKKLRLPALFLIGLTGMPVFFALLWHRQIYSESCAGEKHFRFRKTGQIQHLKINESSGLAHFKNQSFFTHNDDTDSSLYLINANGKLEHRWSIPYHNRDWEDLCTDGGDRVFIGDFGNNFNRSKALKIYILHLKRNKVEGIIRFKYEDQVEFPPYFPGAMNYDCEAMVYFKDSLYLFTKNKHERSTSLYTIPAKAGTYSIRKKQEINLLGMVTGASIRPDGKELALLTYGKIYFISLKNGMNQIPAPDLCLARWTIRQSESISYWGNDSLLVGNEQRELFLIERK